jgi:ribonuclease HI
VIEVYTDGACSGNPGPGGWAWAVDGGEFDSGGDPETTNQRMELRAALEAVQSLGRPVRVVSDSTYVVNCFRDKWYEGWKKRGWKNANKNPVANRDLWEPLIAEHVKGGIEWQWVKGHSGDRMNDVVDRLAVVESTKLKEAAANPPPSDIDPTWPVEHAVVVGGTNELDSESEAALRQAIAGLNPETDVVVSGMRRGAELVGAELAVEHRVRLAVVLPFADPAARWPDELRERFDVAYSASTWQVNLGANPNQPGSAIKTRNTWMRAAALGAIVVGNEALAIDFDAAGMSVVRVG